MKLVINVIMFIGFFVIGTSCDSIQPTKKRTQTPDEILDGAGDSENEHAAGNSDQLSGYQGNEEDKFFRTGTQFVYAISKMAGVTGAELRTRSGYSLLASNLPKSTTVADNVAQFSKAIPAYSSIASAGCSLFFEKPENQSRDTDELLAELVDRVFLDASKADAALEEAAEITSGRSDDEIKQVSCIYIATESITF